MIKLDIDMLNSELRTDRCSLCEAQFAEDFNPLSMWSSDGWSVSLCDACVESPAVRRAMDLFNAKLAERRERQ